jgi:hypothetical protein
MTESEHSLVFEAGVKSCLSMSPQASSNLIYTSYRKRVHELVCSNLGVTLYLILISTRALLIHHAKRFVNDSIMKNKV